MKKVSLLLIIIFTFATFSAFAENQKKEKSVSRHMFTTSIENREPADAITTYIPIDGESIYYFTELNNMNGTKPQIVWYKNNEVIYKRDVDVKGPRWRYNTSMKANHFHKDDIVRVEVIGEDGTIYSSDILNID